MPARLHAVTREVDPADDALAGFDPHGFAWLHHRTRLVTSGVAARLTADDAAALLTAVDADDPVGLPGTGAVAVGALPFDPDAPGELVIPARVVGALDGRAWVTEIGPPRTTSDPVRRPPPASRSPRRARATSGGRPSSARSTPSRAATSRRSCSPARCWSRPTPRSTRATSLRLLVASQPGSFVYASEGFVGASPELLVRRTGEVVESRPVAGTTVADSDEALLALAASVKDTREHRFVVDGIVDALERALRRAATSPRPPRSRCSGPSRTSPRRSAAGCTPPAPSALDLARLLHPTPAVGGTPRAAALDAIRALEGFDRGRYAGPVGWVDARGDGEWAIALRGAELDGARARLVAGAGIVAGSDPDAEWAETQAKLEPMLRALVRP